MSSTSHTNMLQQAKATQLQDLKQSHYYSKQLQSIFTNLIDSNSNSTDINSPLLDKITTIHELNDDIDRFLNKDIAENFHLLMKQKRKLEKVVRKCNEKMKRVEKGRLDGDGAETVMSSSKGEERRGIGGDHGGNVNENYVDLLQRRCELIDQNLRILEQTLKNIEKS
ncbi:hypothetical protein KGF56_000349 [Candida oxycetoniae]|uniref:Uncharacterized protein n=1 Tax=Candida oxycetoniae TaxID=497107 RepID=A0AAI9X053_9ASCO|nr:uncharacterized protein KGF56_000349 [Candida oxycetoniae]KAI3406744.2 hypothetical protein KGF56_000349 [Candida oxycetoniae]